MYKICSTKSQNSWKGELQVWSLKGKEVGEDHCWEETHEASCGEKKFFFLKATKKKSISEKQKILL